MTARRFALAFGLVFAFSPTLVDLLEHAIIHPWARASLVFPGLAWIAWRSEARSKQPADWGWVAVGLGLLVELAAVAGDVIRLGRLGLGLGLVGVCRGTGWSSLKVASILLWAIPVPHRVIAAWSPELESFWASISVFLLQPLGISITSDGNLLIGPAGSLELQPVDGGMAGVFMLAGLAWFSLVRRSRAGTAMIPRCLAVACAGFPLQLAAVGLAAGVLGLGGDPALLRRGLSWFPCLLVWGTALGLVWTNRHANDLVKDSSRTSHDSR